MYIYLHRRINVQTCILEQHGRILEQTHTYVCGDVLVCVEVCLGVCSLMQAHTDVCVGI